MIIIDWVYLFQIYEEMKNGLTEPAQDFLQDHLEQPVEVFNQSNAVIYNRVPKTGSRVVFNMLSTLSKKHKFRFLDSHNYLDYRPSKEDLTQQISKLQKKQRPWLLNRHIYFFQLNETDEGNQPLYINIVREPISRCVSWYYFIRFEHRRQMSSKTRNRTFDTCLDQGLDECVKLYEPPFRCLQMPFFCGQEDICVQRDRRALDIAKKNVMTKYAVVGLTEDMRSFLQVAEHLIPAFFGGVLNLYDKFGSTYKRKSSNTKHISHSVLSEVRMEELMILEIEFYKFVRKYFYTRHKSLLKISL